MNHRMRGFTQIELLIAASLLTIIAGGVTMLLSTGVDSYRIDVTKGDLERNASRALERVAEEITMSGADVLSPARLSPYSTPTLTLQRNEGFQDGAIVWGAPGTILLVADPEDPDDGKDNNGNGLVDECMLVFRQNAGESDQRDIVLCRYVREYLEGEEPNGIDDNENGLKDERGFCANVDGDVWSLRLTIERRDAKGRLLTSTHETSVRPRN